jgi:nitrate reductase NapE component
VCVCECVAKREEFGWVLERVEFGIQEWNLVIHTAFGIAGLLSVGWVGGFQ